MAEYVKPSCSSIEYIIMNTQKLFQQQKPLLPSKEYISCDVECQLTNVLIQEIMHYILEEICYKQIS